MRAYQKLLNRHGTVLYSDKDEGRRYFDILSRRDSRFPVRDIENRELQGDSFPLPKKDDNRPASPDRHDEVWIAAGNPEHAIRVRSLTSYLQNGGSLKDVRLVQGEDRRWTIYVRLTGRPGEHRVNMFKSDQPKTYRDVDLALACVRDDFGYFGSITLVTELTPPPAKPDKDG